MTRLIRIELLKLRTTPALYVTLAVTVFFTVVSAPTTILLAGQQGSPAAGSLENVSKVLGVSGLTTMVMLVLGILVIAGEYRHRTIMGAYLGEPRRGKILIAKLITVAGLGALVGAAMFGIVLAVAIPLYASKGVHNLPVDVTSMWLGCTLATACFGLLGVALGAVTRNTVGAVIGALIWIQAVELGLLQSLIPTMAKWLPAGAGVAVTAIPGSDTQLLQPLAAGLVLVGWAAVLSLVATRLANRQELR
jgi:ABC-type transport system involved in multi-copper enzyme maturation permease subunit